MTDEKVWERQREIMEEIEELEEKIVRHIDVTEHARIVRKELKLKFPDIKFKVRSDRYAGGCSVRVYHCEEELDKKRDKEVEDFVKSFCGYRGDLCDGRYNVGFEYKGERLSGASFCSYHHKW